MRSPPNWRRSSAPATAVRCSTTCSPAPPASSARLGLAGLESPRPAALSGSARVLAHVLAPELDHVAVGVRHIDRPSGSELDRTLHVDATALEPGLERIDLSVLDREGEVDV